MANTFIATRDQGSIKAAVVPGIKVVPAVLVPNIKAALGMKAVKAFRLRRQPELAHKLAPDHPQVQK